MNCKLSTAIVTNIELTLPAATSSASGPASEEGSGWSKEAKIAIAAIVVAVLLFLTGYGIKWLSRKCRECCSSRKRKTEINHPGSEDEDLGDCHTLDDTFVQDFMLTSKEMGHGTAGQANTGNLEESEDIGRAHHIDLEAPESSTNSDSFDGQRKSSDAEHGSHRHSGTSTDALLGSPNGEISLATSGHGNDVETVTSTEVNGPSHNRPQSAPASSGSRNVVKRHNDRADDSCHADTGDYTKTLISGDTGRSNCNGAMVSANINWASPELKESVS
ncbi:hypothetical protein HDK64DRAFT_249883 [Phyllosticta capitalensis]